MYSDIKFRPPTTSFQLDGKSNLLHYCVEGEGLVQVNVEIKNDAKGRRIDITDVLKPEDDDDDENVQSTDEQQVTDQQANLHFSGAYHKFPGLVGHVVWC